MVVGIRRGASVLFLLVVVVFFLLLLLVTAAGRCLMGSLQDPDARLALVRRATTGSGGDACVAAAGPRPGQPPRARGDHIRGEAVEVRGRRLMVKEENLSQNTSIPLYEARTLLRLARGIKRRHCLMQALNGALLKIAGVAQRPADQTTNRAPHRRPASA